MAAIDPRYPERFSIASMITGVASLPFSCLPLVGLPLAAVALALGVLARRMAGEGQRSLSSIGIVCGSTAMLVTLVFLLLGNSMGNSPVAAVEKVMEQGAQLGIGAQKKYPGNAAAQTEHIAAGLQRIDTRNCPQEFRVAFQRHVQAWHQAIPYVAADTPLTLFFESLYAGYTGDLTPVGQSNYQAQLAAQEINRTYHELALLAAGYGARIPALTP